MVSARNMHVVYFVSSFPLLRAEITHLNYSQLFCLGINGIFFANEVRINRAERIEKFTCLSAYRTVKNA